MELHTQQECLKWGQQKLLNIDKDLEQKIFIHCWWEYTFLQQF